MKTLLIFFALILVLTTACQEKDREPAVESSDVPEEQQQIKTVNPPEIIRLKPGYETEVTQWETYNRLAFEMQKFQKAQPKEYSVIIEALLASEKELSESDFPEKFNIPAVKSRVLVFKTYVLQTKSLLTKEPLASDTLMRQQTKVIAAFNALKKQ
ncbi:MAG: hypothetical protein AAF934_07670, partial [Bacteroidota bacterium]